MLPLSSRNTWEGGRKVNFKWRKFSVAGALCDNESRNAWARGEEAQDILCKAQLVPEGQQHPGQQCPWTGVVAGIQPELVCPSWCVPNSRWEGALLFQARCNTGCWERSRTAALPSWPQTSGSLVSIGGASLPRLLESRSSFSRIAGIGEGETTY